MGGDRIMSSDHQNVNVAENGAANEPGKPPAAATAARTRETGGQDLQTFVAAEQFEVTT